MDAPLAATIHAANQALLQDGDLASVPDLFTPGYVAHLTDRDLTGGHGAVAGFVEMLRGAFPDLTVEVRVLVEGQDRVAWQRTLTGTHTGPFMQVPPSGRRLVWRDMAVSRFETGRIAEEWAVSDLAEHMLLG